MIDIRSDGTKEVLDYCIAKRETWSFCRILRRHLAKLPQTEFQRCWFHLERNLYGYVRKAERGDFVGEFKEIRKAKALPAARQKLNDFIEHWKKRYKRVE